MIRTDRSHLYVAAHSHPGMSGKNNEDNFAVSAYLISKMNPTPSVFAIVSDGIGGHRAGEVASELAVNLVSEAVEKREGGHPLAVFQNSFYRVSEAIFEKAEADVSQRGMGATAACAWVVGFQLYIAYAGDSRIYLMRGKSIYQLRRLFLAPDESDAKAKANQGLLLEPGDVIMLCTDGLTDLVDNSEIRDALNGRTLHQAAEALIALANERGGHDNITVVMLGVPFDPKKSPVSWLPG